MTRSRVATALALGACLGCGHYAPPIRALPPPAEEGRIYDAGQPMQPTAPAQPGAGGATR